ncbi:MAG: hypothetical protein CBB72_012030 [Muricauda sp. TMED12]|nr:MAG: hypothetical protein CBB72_012030 [Muricauda sp. TMED12]
MSWTFSCLQLRKFYDDVELVTDDFGYNLLIENLELPYTNVHVVLDCLNEYHSDLWALGKLYTYGLQDKPFIHVDGDVFIWDRFPDIIETAELCCQNYEVGEPGYLHVYNFIQNYFNYIPNFLVKKENDQISSINAGIIGGTNISFFKEYVAQAFEFVNRNLDKMNGLDIGAYNMFYEQYLFFCLAIQKQSKIHYLIDDRKKLLDQFVNFLGVPMHTNYIHTIGGFKKRFETCYLLEYTFKMSYPEQYYRLIDLLKQQKI